MLLLNDSALFFDLVQEIFEKTDIQPAYIEKDFYAISILKELVSRNDKFVFKGGTSLSVCQKVVNRFSEDIDISYLDEHITVGQRKQIKKHSLIQYKQFLYLCQILTIFVAEEYLIAIYAHMFHYLITIEKIK